MSTTAIGIDLGTTFSAVAHVNQHGVPEILSNAQGNRITPSVIFFDQQEIVVGAEAERNAVASHTFMSFFYLYLKLVLFYPT